ncbi:MAG: sulfite exporter TauE/SafE family protein [Bacteroidia bacterium]
MSFFWAALGLGFIGSFHCVGMCGPIAFALPLNRKSFATQLSGVVAYNAGRVITYGLLGSFFGLIGASFALAGYQQILSIMLGMFMLLSVFLPERVASRFRLTAGVFSFLSKQKAQLGQLFRRTGFSSLFLIGLLNGLLPCGFVYTAVAGAVLCGSSLQGALFMALFGMGTVPAMAIVSLTGSKISLNFRKQLRRFMPVFTVLIAVCLIVRGMNLGIPYLSPKFSAETGQHDCCHRH